MTDTYTDWLYKAQLATRRHFKADPLRVKHRHWRHWFIRGLDPQDAARSAEMLIHNTQLSYEERTSVKARGARR